MESQSLTLFDIPNKFAFWWLIALTSFWLRVIFSLLKALENSTKYFTFNSAKEFEHTPLETKKDKFVHLHWTKRFYKIFLGCSSLEPYPDFWYNTIIGIIELISFPILLHQHLYPFIGAWLAFKIVGQWDAWKINRWAFNRLVIATAIQLIVSYYLCNLVK